MKPALPFVLPLLLLAAACSQPSSDANMMANDVSPPTAESAAVNETAPPFAETPGAHPTAPEPAPIPAKFRGTWAANNSACGDLANHSRLTISGRTIRFSDFVIFGESVTIPSADQFAVKGMVEGTDHPAEAHYSINAAGDVLTDEAGGGAIRVRCG